MSSWISFCLRAALMGLDMRVCVMRERMSLRQFVSISSDVMYEMTAGQSVQSEFFKAEFN